MKGDALAAAQNVDAKWTPYSDYRDSGIPWLGLVPRHWGQKALKRVFRVFNGATPKSTEQSFWDGDIPWVTPEDLGGLNRSTIEATSRQVTQAGYESCGTHLVPSGSLILSTRAPIGHLAIAGMTLCTNQGCRSLVLRDSGNIRYFFYELLAARQELQSLGQGSTFMELATWKLGGVQIANPPLSEQEHIVKFLDCETAKIDALVAKHEQLIALLEEKRAALISRAVTRGLDPNIPMKDSGIPWLGAIPAHWETKQLKWAVTFQRGHDLPADGREEGDTPVVSSSGVSDKHSIAKASAPGIVTGRYGTIGQFYLIEQDYWPLNTTLYSIDLRKNDARYLRYMLHHLAPLFLVNAVKSAVPGVDRNDIHPVETTIPLITEQRTIANYLDETTTRIDRVIAKIGEAVERMVEYRTVLISAVVTGKIDVRKSV